MADVSHQASDLSTHPDISEMRARYARMMDGPQGVAVDGLVFLAGLYLAISPYVVHFSAQSHELALCNLIVGIAIAVLGLGLTLAPAQMFGLTWALTALGVWLIISPWVATVGHSASRGMIWNNVIVGGLVCLLGFTAASMVLNRQREGGGRASRRRRI
ncbi:SPW repeat protein [Kitasatospora sp. NPDC052896]|uniref:SPW repeat protein n=1 Tax=Kitasatospora sp. NPDC052896 TaxID=3364061 RepID=UPI0037C84BC8